jgi:transcription elongation factor Elf1
MTIDKAIELLPCPFCNSNNLIEKHLYGTIEKPAYCIECDNCGARNAYTDKCHKTNWNTRTAPPDTICITRQELEGMRKPNEWIPTSKREKDIANYAHNALIDKLLERT